MMTKTWRTAAVMATFALVSMCLVAFVFDPLIRTAQGEITRYARALDEHRELMKRKESFMSEWQVKKNYFVKSIPADEIFNSWQKSLMASVQAESLALNKLEPAGLKDGEASVFLSFEGDMKKLIRFIYGLMTSDPLAKIKSFSMKQEEGAKNFTFEMLLGKVAG